eukprot:13731291-Heterocapsa_arctica.AAC.1
MAHYNCHEQHIIFTFKRSARVLYLALHRDRCCDRLALLHVELLQEVFPVRNGNAYLIAPSMTVPLFAQISDPSGPIFISPSMVFFSASNWLRRTTIHKSLAKTTSCRRSGGLRPSGPPSALFSVPLDHG